MSESIETVTQPAPSGETAPQPDTNTVPATGTEQTQADTAAPQTETEAPKPRPWYEKVIAERAYEAREAKRQAEAAIQYARQVQAQLQPQEQQSAAPPPGYVPAAEVHRIAAQQVAEATFTQACNEVADHGEATFPDFGEAVQNFTLMGGPPAPLLEAITALGKEDGSRVYYELGKNPGEAQRILSLSPARMAVEIARMASKPRAVAPVSRAPAPITPVNARSTGATRDPSTMSDSEYRSWFATEYAKYRKR